MTTTTGSVRIFRVSIWIQFADTALEDIVPAHFEEVGYHYIIIPGYIANQKIIFYSTLLIFKLIDNGDSIRVIAILLVALQP